jgi:dolichyl-phosphate-mannose-protein mannosyltransferase
VRDGLPPLVIVDQRSSGGPNGFEEGRHAGRRFVAARYTLRSVVNTRSGAAHFDLGYSSLGVLSAADVCSAIVACTLVAMTLAYIRTDVTYDEATYLQLARRVTESGLPLRRAYDDFTQFQLFENSPPLVVYVASLSQVLFPRNDLPARVIHLAVFVLPTYMMVWWFARKNFGEWAAVGSLVAMLTNASYVQGTTHVTLNIPLGMLSLGALLMFYEASFTTQNRRVHLALMMLATALAVWTKYQAACIYAAVALYLAYTVATERFAGIQRFAAPLTAMVLSGASALIVLIWYYWAFGGTETLTHTLTFNASRAGAGSSMSLVDIARSLLNTLRECEGRLGGAVLLLGIVTASVEHRHRGLVVLITSFVAITIAFNLIVFHLPGAGTTYLDPAVAALALLSGPAAVRIVELATTTLTRMLLVFAAITIQFAGSSTVYGLTRPNGSRDAAAYIAANSAPMAGVLAETVAIEFYSDHPVRAVSHTYPRQLVLRSLEGTSGDDISYVVIDAKVPPENLESIEPQWSRLLAEHFELVPSVARGLHVYRRRPQ